MGRKKSSRRQTVAVAAVEGPAVPQPTVPPPSLWILDSWRDLALFVATPLLILPLVELARRQWSAQEIALFVAAFGALGHHFPGMLRAYGDRDLFQRFKTRFIVAPLFLAVVCTLFAMHDMGGMVFVAAVWGIWHGLAQTYGFLRIYDAKRKSFAQLTARLDRAMCVAWFGLGILMSPGRMHDLLDRLYRQIGVPLLPDAFIPTLAKAWLWGTIAVTATFLVHSILSWRRGQPPSPIKLLLMVTSFCFWWFACVAVDNMLVGVALFEIFHDVQYLSIVWIFNRNRAKKSESLSGFMSFLFRRSGALVGLYVGLVFAYGSLAFVSRGLPVEPLKNAMKGLLVASALLHFYYDGFIWKMRERSTRESLGLKGGLKATSSSRGLSPGMRHALNWVPFVLLIAWLGLTEARASTSKLPPLTRARALVAAVPESERAHHDLGKVLAEVGRVDEAIVEYRRSLEIRADQAEVHYDFAKIWAEKGDTEAEFHHLSETLRLDPEYAEAHNDLSLLWARRGDFEKELRHLEEALRLQPEYAEAHNNMGVVLASGNEFDKAIEHFRMALQGNQQNANTYNNLGLALAETGELEEAIQQLQKALELEPGLREAQLALQATQRKLASRP